MKKTTQKTLKPSQNVSMPRMNEKKLHTQEFQLRGSSRNMRCKLLQKRFTGTTTECSKHLHNIATEKDILLELNRCIFQISLKYIKLVIPKILFILVFSNFKFLLQNYVTAPKKITLPQSREPTTPPPAGGVVHALGIPTHLRGDGRLLLGRLFIDWWESDEG